jgi:hypothetical protein
MSASRFNLRRRVVLSLITAALVLLILMWLFSILVPDPAALAPTHPPPAAEVTPETPHDLP